MSVLAVGPAVCQCQKIERMWPRRKLRRKLRRCGMAVHIRNVNRVLAILEIVLAT